LLAPSELSAENSSAEAVIEKYVEAIGGREAFARLSNRVMQGEFSLPDMGIFTRIEAYSVPPDKSYVHVDTGGYGTAANGVQGDLVWDLNPMAGARILEGAERAARLRQAAWDPLLAWQEHFREVTLGEEEEVHGRDCSKLIFTPHEGETETLLFDKESGLLTQTRTSLNGTRFTGDFSDYREVDGVMIPFRIMVSSAQLNYGIRTESIEHNLEIPNDRFDPPQEIQALIK
jgi:hypothetical protein